MATPAEIIVNQQQQARRAELRGLASETGRLMGNFLDGMQNMLRQGLGDEVPFKPGRH